jgi:hypothetical protein
MSLKILAAAVGAAALALGAPSAFANGPGNHGGNHWNGDGNRHDGRGGWDGNHVRHFEGGNHWGTFNPLYGYSGPLPVVRIYPVRHWGCSPYWNGWGPQPCWWQ